MTDRPASRGNIHNSHPRSGGGGVMGRIVRVCGESEEEMTATPERLAELLKASVEAVKNMTPDEREAMLKAQAESWVRGEMGLRDDSTRMTKPKPQGDGGPAFPGQLNETGLIAQGAEIPRGMSLRDWFAGQALVAIGTWVPDDFRTLAIRYPDASKIQLRVMYAYELADAAMAWRKK